MDVTATEHYSTQHHRRQTSIFGQFRFYITFLKSVSSDQVLIRLVGHLMNEVMNFTSSWVDMIENNFFSMN